MAFSERGSFCHLGAFESTKLIGCATDILGTTNHIARWEHDLGLLRSAGIVDLRYSVPWHRIEMEPGRFDFSWMDEPMQYMRAHSMCPILDPLHHVSFPDWLDQGFANPAFPELYERFILAIATRYPWATRYTVCNEPLPTAILSGLTGDWYPYHKSDDGFVRIAVNLARAICLASAALRRNDPEVELVHVDSAETHWALDGPSERWVRFANERRFLVMDLVLGRVTAFHALYPYLRQHGFTEQEMYWFLDHPAPFDQLALDYYPHSEMDWHWDRQLGRANLGAPVRNPAGFARVARAYTARYRVPVLLGETNVRGSYGDRITWLKLMEEQCEELSVHTDFRGFCWYPSIDSTDWCNLCTKATGAVDPQGIWGLDVARWHRESSELSELYSALARGSIRAKDLPAYRFSARASKGLDGHALLMTHWPTWIDQGERLTA